MRERLIVDKDKLLKLFGYLPDILVDGKKDMFIRTYGDLKLHLDELSPEQMAEKLYKGRCYLEGLVMESETVVETDEEQPPIK